MLLYVILSIVMGLESYQNLWLESCTPSSQLDGLFGLGFILSGNMGR